MNKRKEKIVEILFLTGVFVFLLFWAVVQPFNASPDEAMKYNEVWNITPWW